MNPALPANASLDDRGHLGRVLSLSTPGSRVEIALRGATVLSFAPKLANGDDRSVLWLSRDATAAPGKPIRGGVPVCAPWFGPHPNAATAPAHGLARICDWDLLRVEELAGASLKATFTAVFPKDTDRGWNHDVSMLFTVTAGKDLAMELTVRNTGPDAFLLSEALHTYFAVSDVRKVRVEGLENTPYLDFAGDGKRHMSDPQPLTLAGETTYMFYSGKPVRLVDEGSRRVISIQSCGAANSIVWNPGEKTASKTGDILDQWPGFLCVETANIPDSAIPLPPNTSHHMGTTISVESL
jgi:D-hexose-6-phosphate mutarotase